MHRATTPTRRVTCTAAGWTALCLLLLGCPLPDLDTQAASDADAPAAAWFGHEPEPSYTATSLESPDADGDGFEPPVDCNDSDPDVHPDAVEVPYNGKDDDCNAFSLDDDLDLDGFAAADDCNDSDAAFYPGALELCDGEDNDCDGVTDETEDVRWFEDMDGDGWGNPYELVLGCDAGGEGYVRNAGDCDDEDDGRNPSVLERCDGVDEDCNGLIDDDPLDPITAYVDLDADGAGAGAGVPVCTLQPGQVTTPGDCNDSNPQIHPLAEERCDTLDRNCDGSLTDGATDAAPWFADADGDGFGDGYAPTLACAAPLGFVADNSDCDDARGFAYPGAPELCDGIDGDCNGTVDDTPVNAPVWFADEDGDGFGNADAPIEACVLPVGAVANNSDCDDSVETVFPGAPERCNGLDDDCDPTTDDDPALPATWYADADGDGFGTPGQTLSSCSQPLGFQANALDCDDANAAVRPDGVEVCDGLDNDCSGAVDDGASDPGTWYADADGDGVGGTVSVVVCTPPPGFVTATGDCADLDPTRGPQVPEICDGIDQNCDGQIDEQTVNARRYADADGDGFGSPWSWTEDCVVGAAGWVDDATDCDDTRADRHPSAEEACDGVDNDCDTVIDNDAPGTDLQYLDADGDGHGNPLFVRLYCPTAPPVLATVASDAADAQPTDTVWVADNTDCDDTTSARAPSLTEWCDGLDNNCDDAIDNDASDASTFLADLDADGWGDASNPVHACTLPANATTTPGDCDDTRASVSPDGTEQCNGLDDDCDSFIDNDIGTQWYADADADGIGNAAAAVLSCVQPGPSYVTTAGDCDDTSSQVRPGAVELCNDVDDNCDGDIDNDAIDQTVRYPDDDGDGWGQPMGVAACYLTDAAGFVVQAGDCDDSDSSSHPGAPELCDGLDNNCDGDADEGLTPIGFVDLDGDGYGGAIATECAQDVVTVGGDCDDTNPGRSPGIDEVCDGLDNDCDNDIDDGLLVPGFVDMDGDGFGTALATTCDEPSAALGGDCDDTQASRYPGAAETCDGLDNDCDGAVDSSAGEVCAEAATCSAYTTPGSAWLVCSDARDWADAATACHSLGYDLAWLDDEDEYALVRHWMTLDGLDSAWIGARGQGGSIVYEGGQPVLWDRIGNLDADAYAGANAVRISTIATWPTIWPDDWAVASVCRVAASTAWYADADGDGYGNDQASAIFNPTDTTGLAQQAGDCDDTRADVYPAAWEVCGEDRDCDGLVDDLPNSSSVVDALNAGAFYAYADLDGDGDGDPTGPTYVTCALNSILSLNNSDCDDTDDDIFDGAEELCDGVDNNCNGLGDEPVEQMTYTDADGDGTAGTPQGMACLPAGTPAPEVDCDDGDSNIFPGATETCDGVDNDCDGDADSAAICPCDFYEADGSTYLLCDASQSNLTADRGWTTGLTTWTWWQAEDVCNSLGYSLGLPHTAGFASTVAASTPPGGIFVGASDVNTEGTWVDQTGQPPTFTNWAPSQPDDSNGSQDCATALQDTTWDDRECSSQLPTFLCESIAPGNAPTPTYTLSIDADGDGHGDANGPTVQSISPSAPGFGPPTDCDDDDPDISPDDIEVCDRLDNDCSGARDDNQACPCETSDTPHGLFMVCTADNNALMTAENGWTTSSSMWSYTTAATACEDMGYHLAVPNNAQEQAALEAISPGSAGWIGLNDSDTEGTLVDLFGNPASYTNWDVGEPNNSGMWGEDCVELRSDGLWNDAVCWAARPVFFCEAAPDINGDATPSPCVGAPQPGDTCLAGDSCNAALANGATQDGTYTLNPNGVVDTYTCDMTSSGGGWTLVFEEDFNDWQQSDNLNDEGVTECGGGLTILGGPDGSGDDNHSLWPYTFTIDLSAVTGAEVRTTLTRIHLDHWDDGGGSEDISYVTFGGAGPFAENDDANMGNDCGAGGQETYLYEDITLGWPGTSIDLVIDAEITHAPIDESLGIDDIKVWVR